MQVISRRVSEGLVIGDEIVVTVLEIRNNSVRLAISDPNETPSYREEVIEWSGVESFAELELTSRF